MPDPKRFLTRISHLPLPAATVIAAVLLVATALADASAGRDVSLVIFYLLPVVLMAWVGGPRLGVLTGVIAGVTGLALSIVADSQSVAVASWNALARTFFYVFTAWLVGEVHLLLEESEHFASIDMLTGLLNRRAFYAEAAGACRRSRRKRLPVALMYLDLDGLKQVNDRDGHEAGDVLLVDFVRTTKAQLRTHDLFARLGGDEFAILLLEADDREARGVADRIQVALAGVTGRPVRASIGVAVSEQPPIDLDELLRPADRAMYQVKQAGGAGVRLAG